jgi:thioredoxin
MHKFSLIILSVILLASCNNSANKSNGKTDVQNASITEQPVIAPFVLTDETFKTKVFDYSLGKEWKYVDDKPCIIDFYADWCKPCKRLGPIMDELAVEYKDQVNFYKVNIDNSKNVSTYFNIDGIPAVFLIPMKGESRSMVGLYPKEEYVKAIAEVLLNKAK